MEHTLFTQVLAAQLPAHFWGTAVIDELKHLEDAGYIKMALSPPLGAAPPRATVNEITHLGRAAARYFAADAGFFGRAQAMHRASTPVPRPVAGQARSRSVAC